MKYDKILKCKNYCNNCSECKRFLGKSTRKFCGSLYVDEGRTDYNTEVPIIERLGCIECVKAVHWQLERGKLGNLHYQLYIEVSDPIRRTALMKLIKGFTKGEWIEPVACDKAQEKYVMKEDTRVSGPWEYYPEVDDKSSAAYAARIRKSRVGSLSKDLHERTTEDVINCTKAYFSWKEHQETMYVALQMHELERKAHHKFIGY